MNRVCDALADAATQEQLHLDPDLVAGYPVDWTRRWNGKAAAVVRPRSGKTSPRSNQ
jgi:hypothetical protein